MRIFLFVALCFAALSGNQADASCDSYKACNHMAYCKFTFRNAEWKEEPQVHAYKDALDNDQPQLEKDLTRRCQELNGNKDGWDTDGGNCSNEEINQIGRHARINGCSFYASPAPPPNNKFCVNCRTHGSPQVTCGKPESDKLHNGNYCECSGQSGQAISTPSAPCD